MTTTHSPWHSGLLVIAVAAGLAGCGDDDDARVRTPAQAAAASGVAAGFAGAAAGTVTSSRIDTGSAGLAVLATKTAVAPDSLFSIGSNTKAMTSVVAARLIERGAIRWDTRIGEALPELQATMLPAYAGVTLEQLLAHRGGVRPYTGSDDLDAFAAFLQATTDTLPTDEAGRRLYLAAHVLQQPPLDGVVPGSTFSYSNAGYVVAAAMLERATGRSFEALFDAEITQPLEVAGRWGRPELAGAAQPHGYWGQPGRLTLAEPEDPDVQAWLDTLAPAGLFATTARAYATWLQWNLRALAGAATPLPAGYVQRLRALAAGDYAVGWAASTLAGRTVLVHDGAIEGFLADAVVEQDGSRAAFVLTNTSDLDVDDTDSWVIAELNALLVSLEGGAGG